FTALATAIAALVAVPLSTPDAQALDTPARNAFVIDLATDTVLLNTAAETPMPPASMSKLMTVYMVFARLK
ncbi:unnamed protein product, partial [Laminaria digitata]